MDKHPPGYAVILHYWIRAFGDSEWSVRVPSVIAGVLAVYAMYRFGRTLVSERVGLTASGLMAVAHMPLYFSQDARSYVFVLLFVIWGAHGLVVLAQAYNERTVTWGQRILVMLTLSIASYLHYFGLLFVALAGLFALVAVVKKHLGVKDWAVVFLGAALLYVPWLTAVVTHATERSSWMKTPSERLVENVANQLASGVPWIWLSAIVVALSLVGYDYWRARKQGSGKTVAPVSRSVVTLLVVLVLWIVLPFIAAVGVSYAIIPVISARNMIIVEPAVFLLIAMALSKIDERVLRGLPIVTSVAVAFLLYHTVVVARYYTKITKRHYRAVAAYVEKRVGEEPQRAFVVTENNWEKWLDYYWKATAHRSQALDGIGRELHVAASTRNVVSMIDKVQPESVWFVVNSTKGMTRLPERLEGYKPEGTKKFVGIAVRHFIRTDTKSTAE